MERARIRPATEDDLDVLIVHRREMWKELGSEDEGDLDAHDRSYRRWARQRMRTGRLLGWVVETRDGTIVASGCVWLQPIQPRPGRSELVMPYLLSMYTEPAHRGQGLARRIVKEAIAWCRENGYWRVTLHAATKARPLYGRMGFVRGWEMRARLAPKRKAKRR